MNEKIYCTSCGAENEAGAHFCVSCGTKLETHVQDQNPNTESLTGDVVSNNTQSTYTYTTQPAQSAQTYYSVPEEPKKEGGFFLCFAARLPVAEAAVEVPMYCLR